MPSLICAQCKKLTPRTGQRQMYCAECRRARRRAAGADRERRRRAEHGEAINARSRERYATDPDARQRAIEYAKAYDQGRRRAPQLAEDYRRARAALAQGHRDRTVYGGARPAVLERDGGRCQRCGSKPRKPHVHHIDGRGCLLPIDQQNNDLENLITLCASCHAKVHREREAAARAERDSS